ncbi:hypothetical protein BV20DRAFT_552646 [Pilatotrama ljubarskyi]|nr:hypothetical protein BV20DRAFT_552646 [Pilatotrama ljubarskyi]
MYGLHAFMSSAFAGQGLVRAAAAGAGTPSGVTPTAPGPSDVFNEGANCTFSWTPDPSGTWKQTDVELMTGDNFNMVFVTSEYSVRSVQSVVPRPARAAGGDSEEMLMIARARACAIAVASFDGTDASLTTFSYPCPDVEPNAAIYFYQFTSPSAPADRFWTTRFAIADAQGKVAPPTNATQPDGQPIPWGTGALKDPSKAVPEPSYLVSGGAVQAGVQGRARRRTRAAHRLRLLRQMRAAHHRRPRQMPPVTHPRALRAR